MTEPISAALGIKPAVLVASFAGAVVSLQFLKNLTPKQGIFTVLTGLCCAVYLSPFLAPHVPFVDSIPVNKVENGAAFFVGFMGMNIVAAFVGLDIKELLLRWAKK